MSVVYLKSRKRRPVWQGPYPVLQDAMAVIPYGWCHDCGAEVYLAGQQFCPGCKRKENEYGNAIEISLQTL